MTEHSTEMGLTLRLSLLQAGEIIPEPVTESLPGNMAKVHMVSARFWQQVSMEASQQMGRKAAPSHLQPVLPRVWLCFTFLHSPSLLGLHIQLPLQGIL